jgi:putative lipoic acid-binding regulatory protein
MSDHNVSELPFIENLKVDDSQQAPKIEFPCEYPVKIIGQSGPELYRLVIRVMETHSPGFEHSKITVRNSKNRNFQAITVIIIATGPDQLESLFSDLKVDPLVKMVL